MNIFGSLKAKITQYAEAYIKLIKLNFIGGTASLMSYLMFALICLFFIFCIMLLLGLGIVEILCAIGLAKVAAYFITIGIYIILLLIFVGMRGKVTNSFSGVFIKMLTDGSDSGSGDKD